MTDRPHGDSRNVLLLTQVLPYPLYSGARIRAYYMMRHLAKRHGITLVSFIRADDRPEHVGHLKQYCRAVHTVPIIRHAARDAGALLRSLLRGLPAVIARDRYRSMERLLQELTRSQRFDIVHADQTSMAQYALFVRESYPDSCRPRILLDEHNALYLVVERQAHFEPGLRRFLWKREALQLGRYESQLCEKFDHILTVSEQDRNVLLELFDEVGARELQRRITAIPICVETGAEPLPARWDEPPYIIVMGTMFWPPNVEGTLWFAEEVLPLILKRVPDARLTIIGKDPPAKIRMLTRPQSALNGQIEVAGFIADPCAQLTRGRVFIVPVRAGGGMRVKILDAWSWGMPIVSTTIGAEGIDTVPGQNILLADDPEEFAEAVVRVLQDPLLARDLRESGRRWVKARYDWKTVYPRVDRIYERLLQ